MRAARERFHIERLSVVSVDPVADASKPDQVPQALRGGRWMRLRRGKPCSRSASLWPDRQDRVELSTKMPAAEHVAARVAEGVGETSLERPKGHDPRMHLRLLGPKQIVRYGFAFRGQELSDLFEPKPGSLAEPYNGQSVDGLSFVQGLLSTPERGYSAVKNPDVIGLNKGLFHMRGLPNFSLLVTCMWIAHNLYLRMKAQADRIKVARVGERARRKRRRHKQVPILVALDQAGSVPAIELARAP